MGDTAVVVQAAVGHHKATVGQQELLFGCGWLPQLSHKPHPIKILNSLFSLRMVNSEINWTMLGVVPLMNFKQIFLRTRTIITDKETVVYTNIFPTASNLAVY